MHTDEAHRHGVWVHEHHHHGPHRHAWMPVRSMEEHRHTHTDEPAEQAEHHDHAHHDRDRGDDGHGHSHGLVDPSIVRSREGVQAVGISLVVLGVTAAIQATVFVASASVALLADLIHNGGDALTAVPLGIAFVLRSRRGEHIAGYFVVAAIFISAVVAGVEAIDRLVHPQNLRHLWVLAATGVLGFAGNEIAARVRLSAGRRLNSPALIADGHHARTDGYVSLGVVATAAFAAASLHVADPIIGLVMTAAILRVTWQAWNTVRARSTHAEH